LKNEREHEKDATAPPAELGQKITGLTDSNESVGRGARPAEAGGKPAALPALQKDRGDNDYAIEDEEREQKCVKH
jgi:hypothetical protein